jgi:hypothetical protein
LFIIIAIGESIVVTGATAAAAGLTSTVVLCLVVAFVETAALWWLYFGEAADQARVTMSTCSDPGRLARDAYTYLHLPIIAGIIAVAVGNDLLIAEPHQAPTGVGVAMLLGGPALYLLGSAASAHRPSTSPTARPAPPRGGRRPGDRRVIRPLVRGDHPAGDVLQAGALDPPRRPHPARPAIQQQRDHHRRLIGRPGATILAIGAVDVARSIAATASSTNHARCPSGSHSHVRRKQKRLLAIARQEVLRHAAKSLNLIGWTASYGCSLRNAASSSTCSRVAPLAPTRHDGSRSRSSAGPIETRPRSATLPHRRATRQPAAPLRPSDHANGWNSAGFARQPRVQATPPDVC